MLVFWVLDMVGTEEFWACDASNISLLTFCLWVLSRLSALPRVAMSDETIEVLTSRHMLAVGDEVQHLLVHFNEPVLWQRLFLLPFFQSLLNLILEEVRLDSVDHLDRQIEADGTTYIEQELAIDRFRRLVASNVGQEQFQLGVIHGRLVQVLGVELLVAWHVHHG